MSLVKVFETDKQTFKQMSFNVAQKFGDNKQSIHEMQNETHGKDSGNTAKPEHEYLFTEKEIIQLQIGNV